MSFRFEELDYQETPLGPISLRRRSEPMLAGTVIYEVKLDDEFLMSSLFTDAEVQLGRLWLPVLDDVYQQDLDIVVGGLGLGYTAAAVLQYESVGSLKVIELMQPVIDWHRRELVPLGRELTSDPRCTLVHADFFELAGNASCGFDPTDPERLVHGILLDIDHSPAHWLNQGNSAFYTETGLRQLARKLHPGGVFGLWSNDAPDAAFMALLDAVFHSAESHVVSFPNPYTGRQSSNTVYLGCRDARA